MTLISSIGGSVPRQNSQVTHYKEMASGQRSFATTSPAVLMISQRMMNVAGSTRMANQNVESAMSSSQTVDGYLSQSGDIVQRLKELAVRSGDGTMSQSDQDALQVEADQLIDQLRHNYQHASFNGKKVMQGGSDSVAVTSDGTTTDISYGDLDLDLNGLNLTDADAITKIDAALENISSQRTQKGVEQRILSEQYDANLEVEANLREAASKQMDTDFARSTTEMTSAAILNDIGMAIQAQATQINASMAKGLL